MSPHLNFDGEENKKIFFTDKKRPWSRTRVLWHSSTGRYRRRHNWLMKWGALMQYTFQLIIARSTLFSYAKHSKFQVWLATWKRSVENTWLLGLDYLQCRTNNSCWEYISSSVSIVFRLNLIMFLFLTLYDMGEFPSSFFGLFRFEKRQSPLCFVTHLIIADTVFNLSNDCLSGRSPLLSYNNRVLPVSRSVDAVYRHKVYRITC